MSEFGLEDSHMNEFGNISYENHLALYNSG